MADNENGNLSDLALSTPPNAPSSKSSDISIEELGNEESRLVSTPLSASTLERNTEDIANSVTTTADETESTSPLEKNEAAAENAITTNSDDAGAETKGCDSRKSLGEEDITKDGVKEINEQDSISVEEKAESNKCDPKLNEGVKSVNTTESNAVEDDDEDEEFEDETILERLAGLTEMFPPVLTKTVSMLGTGSLSGVKWTYSKGRNITWVVLSTAALLFLPVMIESERVGFEEMEKAKRQQILLGPSSATSSVGTNAPLPPIKF